MNLDHRLCTASASKIACYEKCVRCHTFTSTREVGSRLDVITSYTIVPTIKSVYEVGCDLSYLIRSLDSGIRFHYLS